MYYANPALPSEQKVMTLEALLGYSNTLADVISISSWSSKEELIILAEKCSEVLKDVAHENGPTLLQGAYGSVPILGQSRAEEMKESNKVLDQYHVSTLEMQLEMNLALMQTILIHGKKYTALIPHRGELQGRALRKMDYGNFFGMMQFAQRFGSIRYFDAAAIKSGDCVTTPQNLEWSLQASAEAFKQAQNIADRYNPYNQFLATFNLGRVEILKRENQGLAQNYFADACSIAARINNPKFLDMASYYLTAVEHTFGAFVADATVHKMDLLALVAETLNPRAEKKQVLYAP